MRNGAAHRGWQVDGPVLIAASDMPLLDSETLHRLVEFHTASGNGATVLTTILDDPTGYGRIIRDREGNVLRIVEQKDANRSELAVQEVNTSVYVFEASVLTEAIAGLKSNNAQGEFYLTDALETAKAAGKVGAFAAPDPLTVEGVNDRVQLAALSKTYNRRVCERWMRDGVTILDPETTWIEDDVQIGRDATILPGSFLQATRWSRGRHRRPVHHPDRRNRGRRCRGRAFPRTGIAHRRTHEHRPVDLPAPGQRVRRGCQAGAFVEMKKAHIGNGTKVPHLSYVGDAQLGDHTPTSAAAPLPPTMTACTEPHHHRLRLPRGCRQPVRGPG